MAVEPSVRPATLHAPEDVTVISARGRGVRARVRELWVRRDLVVWFARGFARRYYARTWLGWWWIPLRPLLSLVPRALIFGGVLKAPSNGAPYLLFLLVGSAGWEALYRTWYFGTRSLDVTRGLLQRMYVPRLTIIVASAAQGLVEVALFAAFAAMASGYYTIADKQFPLHLGVNTLLLPVAIVLIIALAVSLGLWTSVFGAQGMRDIRWTVRAVLHIWFLFTPVIYPLSAVPSGFKTAVECNPMTAPMEMLRTAVFDNGEVTAVGIAVTFGTIVIVASFGLIFFTRSEDAATEV